MPNEVGADSSEFGIFSFELKSGITEQCLTPGLDAENREPAPVRIQKILSDHGITSRRKAEDMIKAGLVTVNGITATLGQKARAGHDEIALDGEPLKRKYKPVYIMLNKPRGYVTSMSDERGRKTVLSLVADAGTRVYPVGRLDIDSEGLLLMTNDGQFANTVAHPSYNKTKTYEVLVRGDAAGAVPALNSTMEIDGHLIRGATAELTGQTPDGWIMRITVNEGRNRQVRKMCAICGLRVRELKRVSIGALELGSLKTGQWRYMTQEEVMYFG